MPRESHIRRAVPLNGWEMEVTGSGLGYKNWLVTSHSVAPGSGTIRTGNYVIHHHPFIHAKKIHADELGVPIGWSIAGIRWVDRGSDGADSYGRPAKIEDVIDDHKETE